jgi:hypothetical protein
MININIILGTELTLFWGCSGVVYFKQNVQELRA